MNNSATLIQPQTNNQPASFSRRFSQYKRDKSLRGRSLALANMLESFKKDPDYAEFSPEITRAIGKIREMGRETGESRVTKVLQVLKEFPSTLQEIQEDTGISKKEVILILRSLMLQKVIVEKREPHLMAAGEHYTSFYELISK